MPPRRGAGGRWPASAKWTTRWRSSPRCGAGTCCWPTRWIFPMLPRAWPASARSWRGTPSRPSPPCTGKGSTRSKPLSGAIFESGPAAARLLAAVAAAGVAIKLMDDYLDQELDALLGRRTLAAAVGPGAVAYAMAALALAMLLDGPAAGSLFLAAYAVGMAHDPAGRLPTGLAGWQEA